MPLSVKLLVMVFEPVLNHRRTLAPLATETSPEPRAAAFPILMSACAIVVPPLYVLAPLRSNWAGPVLYNSPVPLMAPEKVVLAVLLTIRAPLPRLTLLPPAPESGPMASAVLFRSSVAPAEIDTADVSGIRS